MVVRCMQFILQETLKILNIYSFLNALQVDISTMLEEAVHYVKFLQLQIKVGFNFDSLRVHSCMCHI